MSDKIVEQCQYCRHSIPIPPDQPGNYVDQLVCRRHPPMPVFNPQAASTDTYTLSKWPIVKITWKCGEFKN